MDKQLAQVPVLIVGAGPVGLSLAIELGRMGVSCVLVEQRDGQIRVPKMSQVSSRIMEYCRRWGIADQVRGAVWSSSHPLDFVYLTSLTGEEVGRFKVPSYAALGSPDYSPEGACTCPQIYFDPILADKAKSMADVSIRYNTRLVDFEQNDDGVQVRLADGESGEAQSLSARYLVGCDGAGGMVRRALDIDLDGQGAIANSVNIFFRSPELSSIHDKGWARFYRLIGEEGCWSELIAIDGKELWRLTVFQAQSGGIDADACLRNMAGCDFAYNIIDVSPWERRDFVAGDYHSGSVLIAGDAAHECSPTGGLGMHTGICEAVNLAWKLAALVDGWGGSKLLSSYASECRPIARRFVDRSSEIFNAIAALPGSAEIGDFLSPETVRGLTVPERTRTYFTYVGSPLCDACSNPSPEAADPFSALLRPGSRAPHGWISEGVSTIDLFGDGFVLLRFGGSSDEFEDLAAAAARRQVPLKIVDIDQPDIAALFGRRLALIRPDCHIAWLGDQPPADAIALIDLVRGS